MTMISKEFPRLCSIVKTHDEKKKKSVIDADSMLSLVRVEVNEIVDFATNRRAKNRSTIMSQIFQRKVLYQIKPKHLPNELNLETLKKKCALGISDLGEEEALVDKKGNLARKKLVELDYLRSAYSVNSMQLKELFKIFDAYKSTSTFLPEIYSADMISDKLNIKMQHFE